MMKFKPTTCERCGVDRITIIGIDKYYAALDKWDEALDRVRNLCIALIGSLLLNVVLLGIWFASGR